MIARFFGSFLRCMLFKLLRVQLFETHISTRIRARGAFLGLLRRTARLRLSECASTLPCATPRVVVTLQWGCSGCSARGPWRREAPGVTIAAIILGVGEIHFSMHVMLDVYRQRTRRAAIWSRSRLTARLHRLRLLPYAHLHLAKHCFERIFCCDCLLRAAFELLTVLHGCQHAENLC